MAFHIQFSSLLISTSNFMISRPRACLASTSVSRLRSGFASCPVQCVADITRISNDKNIIARRSANYQPPIWNFDFVQSLQSQYTVTFLALLIRPNYTLTNLCLILHVYIYIYICILMMFATTIDEWLL